MAKQSTLWFGYLEAGKKGSFVVRDAALDTGTSKTIYLFNRTKQKILEYRRDIVESKLRELTEDEAVEVERLREEFESARSGFTPRVARRPATPPPPARKRRSDEEPDLSEDDDEKPSKHHDDDEDDDLGPEPGEVEDADDED
jgi:hypothetical protein